MHKHALTYTLATQVPVVPVVSTAPSRTFAGYVLRVRKDMYTRIHTHYTCTLATQVPVVPVVSTAPNGAVTTTPQAVEVPLKQKDFVHKAKVFFPMSGRCGNGCVVGAKVG